MNYQTLEAITIGPVATVTSNHPEVFDALSEAIPQSAFRNPHFSTP
jgi:hypothetical protein